MKKIYVVLLIIIITFLILVNFYNKGFILGLDNISPYFNSLAILNKTFGSGGVQYFAYSPMLLMLPFFELLKIIHIPLWLINQIYIFLCLILGVFGAGTLVSKISERFKGKNIELSFLIGSILYLCNLVAYWIFNQPNYFFLASFASIPWLIDWLLDISNNLKFKFNGTAIVRIFSLILFLQTFTNLVVTASYTFAILIISFVLTNFNKENILKLLKPILILVLALLTISQLSLFIFSGSKEFVLSNLVHNYTQIRNNPMTEQITKDLRASGVVRNSLINNIVFKNSWVETHDINGNPLFNSLSYYENPVIIVLGLIPFGLSLLLLFSKNKVEKKFNKLHLVVALGLLLMSATVLKLTENIPLISEFFRWSGSKFWPLLLIPLVILSTIKLIQLNKTSIYLILLLSLIFVFPIFQGKLFSKQLKVSIPSYYFELDSKIEENETYYYLPIPQDSYFYTYKFGYFGSDFVTYLTKGDSLNTGVISYFNNYTKYQNLLKQLETCESKTEGIKIIWDNNISGGYNVKACLDNKYNLVDKLGEISIYE